jgi:DNA-binding transcriptional ArsR family regulator
MDELERDHLTILGLLGTKGLASAKELQEATGKSQPTVSRLLVDLSAQVMSLGHRRRPRSVAAGINVVRCAAFA